MRHRLLKLHGFMLCMVLGALVLGASIIERIDLGCASNLMRVLTNVTAPSQAINKSHHFPET